MDPCFRWSLIAGRMPGRADKEIKNYWNTIISKRVQVDDKIHEQGSKPVAHQVIRTKAVRCTKVIIPWNLDNNQMVNNNIVPCGYSEKVKKPQSFSTAGE